MFKEDIKIKYDKHYTDEELLNILRDFYKKNNRRPYMKDFKGKIPSDQYIINRFGTWLKAIEKAGIPKGKLRESDYTKEEMINFLIEYYKKYNKIPTTRGMMSKGYPNTHAYINHFGSFKQALIEAGLFDLREDKHQFCEEYTDKQLLEKLKQYMKDKDRIPTYEIMKQELSPSVSTYDRRFNGVFNAFKLIGWDIDKQLTKNKEDIKLKMVKSYNKLYSLIGRTPTSRDIEKYSRFGKGFAMKTYESHFGSLHELQIANGYQSTALSRHKTRKDLIEDLQWLAKELDRTPSQNDLVYYSHLASNGKYIDVFGSWNEAVKQAGLKPNSTVYYSTNGIECLSYYELLFTNMLEKHNLNFTCEDLYKDYIPTTRLFRFDRIVNYNNKKYFVELFCMTNSEDYEKRTKTKIELCKKNNISLIEIYPEDFTSNNLAEVYKIFINKIKEFDTNKQIT